MNTIKIKWRAATQGDRYAIIATDPDTRVLLPYSVCRYPRAGRADEYIAWTWPQGERYGQTIIARGEDAEAVKRAVCEHYAAQAVRAAA